MKYDISAQLLDQQEQKIKIDDLIQFFAFEMIVTGLFEKSFLIGIFISCLSFFSYSIFSFVYNARKTIEFLQNQSIAHDSLLFCTMRIIARCNIFRCKVVRVLIFIFLAFFIGFFSIKSNNGRKLRNEITRQYPNPDNSKSNKSQVKNHYFIENAFKKINVMTMNFLQSPSSPETVKSETSSILDPFCKPNRGQNKKLIEKSDFLSKMEKRAAKVEEVCSKFHETFNGRQNIQ